MTRRKHNNGFTIVELLIVVVVVAILAAITIVSYNGISRKATESAIKSDLNTAAKQLNIAKVESGSYPSNTNGIKTSGGAEYAYSATDDTFCLSATKGAIAFKITEAGAITEGDCDTTTGPTMQAFTPAMCASLTTYTGANESAIITLTDTRADEQEYQVAKLADGKCWMLTNLRLGSTTAAITLTPSDSDVASNFTLPQVTIPAATDYDTPQAIGPVSGDTGAGATNYGYLYNFPAATAGETRSTLPATGGDAQHSICAKGWKLPTGNTTGDFALLNAKMNNPAATSPSTSSGTGYYQNWQNTGPFKGVFSGNWYVSFNYQGSDGDFWSRSAYPSNANNAFFANFYSSYVFPGADNDYRSSGFGVRCLLN